MNDFVRSEAGVLGFCACTGLLKKCLAVGMQAGRVRNILLQAKKKTTLEGLKRIAGCLLLEEELLP